MSGKARSCGLDSTVNFLLHDLCRETGARHCSAIRSIWSEMDLRIIDLAVNPDQAHLFFQYPPKYSLSFIAKKIKGRSSRILRQEFPRLRNWCGEHLWSPGWYHGSVGQGWDAEVHFITELF